MARKNLTDKALKALKPAAKGTRYDVMDATVPAMGVRVTDKIADDKTGRGRTSFFLLTRFPGSNNPTRRALGEYPALPLADARDKAREWLALIERGIDPKDEEERQRAEQEQKQANTWKAIVEDYLTALPNRKRNRHIEQDEREIRRELIERKNRKGKITWSNPWNDKPFADVTDYAIAELIATIKDRPAPGMAYNTVGHIKAIYTWATLPKHCPRYGLTPANNIVANRKPKHYELASKQDRARERVLSDTEILAYWKAADATPYPLGPFYKLLMLTGQRKAECSDAEWKEFDIDAKRWTVPPERFKSGQSHIVPLSDDAIALLESLPRFVDGKCLFSTTKGKKPINGFSRAKQALDKAMMIELKKSDPEAALPHWRIHDVRRTVRTRLGQIGVTDKIAELVIGHDKKGLERVYNHYKYENEMRDALDRWSIKLRSIVSPTPSGDNLIPFERTA